MPEPTSEMPNALPLVLYESQPHPCAYLPGRLAVDEFGIAERLPPAIYERLMNRGFRRSGRLVYRPVCDGCRECVPLRVRAADFVPSRSQRRVLRRNCDVQVAVGRPEISDEKYRLFCDYVREQHDGQMAMERAAFSEFLYQSPTDTREMVLTIDDRPAGVGIVDVCPGCVSSVYFFFDPVHARRSLGVFSALKEIEMCRQLGIEYWYAGFFVRECDRMNYKASFRPYELLDRDGRWHREAAR